MSLQSGTRLGPYEIVGPIGAGGMGEVFHARDTRLNRSVAIKVLSGNLTSSPELRERFDREARAISSLNHPNICTLYDVGHQDGTDYLVMELVEGETLAERIARGPLPLSQVLRHGAEIAGALGQAHRAGIAHRDLKPGNIMITATGVKLLDFGLAKLVTPTGPALSDQSMATARLDPLTADGSIIGTLQYMSPEQIEGKPVDHRTDIFSLGMILHEMATAQRVFGGGSRASLMSAILSSDPAPIRSLQPALPPALEQIILTALQKNPDERWQTAQDLARQLRWIGETSPSQEPTPSPARGIGILALFLIPIVALMAALWALNQARLASGTATETSTARLHLSLPADLSPVNLMDTGGFALSPDGRTLCFVAVRDGTRSLYLRSIGAFEFIRIEGSENAAGPFWSSDGKWIGFSARGKLWKTKLAGGSPPEAICDVSANGAIASWVDRTILFCDAPGGRPEIFRVSDSGGTPVPVSRVRDGEWRHTWPLLLPDGKRFLYQSYDSDSFERRLMLASLESPETSILVRNVSQARFAGTDQLLYVRDGSLLAQTFDVSEGKLAGEPAIIAREVSYFYPTAGAAFDASPAGGVVYRTETRTTRLSVFNRQGTESRVIDDTGRLAFVRLSPDGKKAAVSVYNLTNGLADIWLYDLGRALRDRFTTEPGIEVYPVWSPDGRFIVYSEAQGGTVPHIVRRELGESASEGVTTKGEFQTAGSLSPDGAWLYVTRRDVNRRSDILRVSMATKQQEVLLGTEFFEGDPQASPDGKWLAFTTDVSGTSEIYLQSLSDRTTRLRLSSNGGRNPRWRRDGRELFYLAPSGGVVSASPSAPDRWEEPRLEELFRIQTESLEMDVMPDGQSFLILQGTPGEYDALFHVILGLQ